jgi:hypothetical protein
MVWLPPVLTLCVTHRDEFDRKKSDVEKMLIGLVLKVDTRVPKSRLEETA